MTRAGTWAGTRRFLYQKHDFYGLQPIENIEERLRLYSDPHLQHQDNQLFTGTPSPPDFLKISALCAYRVRSFPGTTLRLASRGLPRKVGIEIPGGVFEIGFTDDVVPIEYGPCLVSADRRRYSFGRSSPHEIANARAPQIVK
jgi:hypothetical protein